MKIIKKNSIEIWFSAIRYLIKDLYFNEEKYILITRHVSTGLYPHILYHRKCGPSKIYNKFSYWYKADRLHRINGPSIISSDSVHQRWYLHGKIFKEDEYWNK